MGCPDLGVETMNNSITRGLDWKCCSFAGSQSEEKEIAGEIHGDYTDFEVSEIGSIDLQFVESAGVK